MFKGKSGKLISWLLIMLIVISVMPVQAFAQEETNQHNHEYVDVNSFEETLLLKEVKSQINKILDKYLGIRVMPFEDVEEVVWNMEEDELINAWEECEALRVKTETMTGAEVYLIKLYESTETFGYFYEILAQIFNGDFAFFAASGTHSPVEGITVGVSGATDNSMSNGAVTVTAKGSAGVFGIGASAKTATVTVYNDSGSTATISFDWTATSINELKIDGAQYNGASGSFGKVLDSEESFVITITTAKNSTINKLVMNNFAIVASKDESDVTFDFDSTLGSVTVGGNAVSDGEVVTLSKEGTTAVAAAKSGVAFLGWIDMADHTIISSVASFTLQPADDMTVKPVFVKTSPWFLINGNSLYEGLNEAMTAVGYVANKTVILANNATLTAGDYTIPAGVTLLIPRDMANTLYTSTPGTTDAKDYVQPTAYRTLTMASGAKITLNGAISIAAIQAANGGLSAPFGATAFIKMESDSSITVNSGANLYAWGYIMGSGSVTVKKGGTVYECFQVTNWRGGDNTSKMVDNDYGVFPLNQYYVQNIEVPLKLEEGAIENGYMSVAITMVGIQGSAVPFVGPNGMFNILSGSITKDYDESTDRLVIDIDGEIGMQSLSLSMKLGLLGTKTIDSEKYELPITNNLTVSIKNGGKVAITQDIAILPGAELIVENGATCELGSGYNIYIYDANEWAINNFATPTDKVAPIKYAPGKPLSVPFHNADSDAHIHVAGLIDASKGNVYVTESGANITGEEGAVVKLNHSGTQTITYQVHQTGTDGKTLNYIEIPIKPISLIENDNGIGGTYDYIDNAWVKTKCTHRYVESTTSADCVNDGGKIFTCPCGDTYIAEVIPATGHTEVDVEAVAPTCTKTGLTAGKKCSVCGVFTVPQETVDALGHNYKEELTTAPTCTEAGVKTFTCTGCGDTYTQVVDALGHKASEAVIENKVAATCYKEGYYETVVYCSVAECEHEISRTPVTVDKIAHTPAEAVKENEVEAKPGVAGSYDMVVYCSVAECKAEVSRTTEVIPALPVEPEGPVVDNTLIFAAKPSVVYGTASIEMAFRVANTVLAKYDDVKIVIIPQKYDTTTLNLVENPAEIVVNKEDLVKAGNTRMQYYFKDLMLYELGLDVNYLLRGYDAEGNLVAVSETFTTSVADYLKTNILASNDSKYKTMATDTLIVCDTVMKNVAVNYPNSDLAKATSVIDGFDISAASQTVGAYNTIDEFNSYNAEYTQASTAAHQIRSSVQVEKVAFINFRIADSKKALDLNKLVVKVSYTSKDSAGEHPYSKEFTGSDFTYAGKYINLKFDQVGIHDSNKDILFEVTYDGVPMCDWTYSVETYLGANQNASNGTMIVALLKLGQSFRTYQGL